MRCLWAWKGLGLSLSRSPTLFSETWRNTAVATLKREHNWFPTGFQLVSNCFRVSSGFFNRSGRLSSSENTTAHGGIEIATTAEGSSPTTCAVPNTSQRRNIGRNRKNWEDFDGFDKKNDKRSCHFNHLGRRSMQTFGSWRIAVTGLKSWAVEITILRQILKETPKLQNEASWHATCPLSPWGNNDCIIRDPSKVRQVNVGDIFFIKGRSFPTGERGLIHKSPPAQTYPDGGVMNRLVLKVDIPLQWPVVFLEGGILKDGRFEICTAKLLSRMF